MEGLPKDFKLLVDPYLKKGHQKLVRYSGESYNNQVCYYLFFVSAPLNTIFDWLLQVM